MPHPTRMADATLSPRSQKDKQKHGRSLGHAKQVDSRFRKIFDLAEDEHHIGVTSGSTTSGLSMGQPWQQHHVHYTRTLSGRQPLHP
jgi:hypothetical protein